jgi:uncharacterized membrane protein
MTLDPWVESVLSAGPACAHIFQHCGPLTQRVDHGNAGLVDALSDKPLDLGHQVLVGLRSNGRQRTDMQTFDLHLTSEDQVVRGEPRRPGIGAGHRAVDLQKTINIKAPVEEVFAFSTEPANQTLINSAMIAFDMDGPMQKGAIARGATRVAGKKLEWTSEVTEFQPNQRVEIRSLEAPMEFHIAWTYEADDAGTTVSWEQDVPSTGGFFGRLSDPLVTRMYARDVRSSLENLKELFEEGS